MSNNTVSIFRTTVDGVVHYTGGSLEEAIRTWDAETFNADRSVPGGVSVETFAGDVKVRDGWVLHVRENGVTFMNPRLALA